MTGLGLGLGTGFGLTTGSTLGGVGGRGLGSGFGVTLVGGAGVGQVEEQPVAHWPLPIQRHEFPQALLHNLETSPRRKENRHQKNEKTRSSERLFFSSIKTNH